MSNPIYGKLLQMVDQGSLVCVRPVDGDGLMLIVSDPMPQITMATLMAHDSHDRVSQMLTWFMYMDALLDADA